MRYEYDVFVSYKRYGEWTNWVCDTFKGVLDSHLSFALGRPARIWIDKEIEAGADWQLDLWKNFTISRVVVPLFSKMYFASDWCLKELYAGRFKERRLGLRTKKNPEGIIVAAKIHNGTEDDLPKRLHECCRIQTKDLTEYALTNLKGNSAKFVEFEATVKSWVNESIKPAIERTRKSDPDEAWLHWVTGRRFRCPRPVDFDDEYPDMSRANGDKE